MSSSGLVTTITSSDNDSSTTSTSAQSTSLPTTTTSTTTPLSTSAQPSTTTSSSLSTTSPIPASTAPPTSNTPQSPTPSPPSSSDPPQPYSTNIDIPATTVLASTTIFITTTNSEGQVMTSTPLVVTEVFTTVGSGGVTTTVTQAVVNPTLAPNSANAGGSSFLRNTGAVVGVFVVVGLAAASIMLWILFAVRRRQGMRRIEQDTAVEAAVAAAGFNRVPLDDDNEDGGARPPYMRSHFSLEMGRRGGSFGLGSGGSGSLPTSGRPPSGASDVLAVHGFNPYADYPVEHQASDHVKGYLPVRTASPPPGAERPTPLGAGTDEFGSARDRRSSFGHTPTYSVGSFEPLLANYAQNVSEHGAPRPPTPPHDARRVVNTSSQPPHNALPRDSNGYYSDGSADDRLDPGMNRRRSSNSGSIHVRDNEDYSRPVLTIRNIPDGQSQHSL
ncbi:hypothetical protein PAXRUDRAFT_319722 [Paxillus rubicundulus Ve08.2h10]|uniref:Uncharacterized protein n=1 Tax=Paxillus rubicundulus Ve08.2h10 TaxID=930991 RepID=A0A0D0EA15_9AGAM|nr:hypothetical protein PAXRUDRAFT_319722 [Paxillus rubicundulus Ve08.2h10]